MENTPTKQTVTSTQNISSMCFVCGTDNSLSLEAQFLNLEDGSICALFTTQEEHQSYPGRVHGGIISAILDETIGRAIQVNEPDAFGVTFELTVKYRQPVPLGEQLRVVARLTRQTKRIFEGTGELLLADNTVAAQASGKYLRQEPDTIAEGGLTDVNWIIDERDAPATVEMQG